MSQEINQEVSLDEIEKYKKNYEKHAVGGTLTDRRDFHRFSGKEIAKLDLTRDIDVYIKTADEKGNRVIVITDGVKSLQRSTCCP